MKKVLYVSTAMILVAGAASAEVTISGNARAGLTYDDTRVEELQVETRLRFNIDAVKETDAGVKLGGRIRLQSDENDSTSHWNGTTTTSNNAPSLSSALIYAEVAGFRVEVGNANTAYDSMGTLYNSELGLTDSSFGDPTGSYFSFNTDPTGPGYTGLYVAYDINGFSLKASYVDPDQTTPSAVGQDDEMSIAVDYASGPIKVGIGGAWNGGGIDGNDVWSATGEYALNDSTNIGLQYHDYDTAERVTLYGNTKLAGGVTIGAYIANDNNPANVDDVAGGIGASYDIGGATIAGAVHRGYNDNTFADLGVKFSF